MKRIIMLILMVAIFSSILTGCSFHPLDNNFPTTMDPMLNKAVGEALMIVDNYKFGNSLWAETSTIAYTIDKNYTFNIVLLYEYDDGYLVGVPVTKEAKVELMDHYKYRELYHSQLTVAFKEALEKFDLPTDGKVIGAVINWIKNRNDPLNWHSICDSDGDAKWDCLSNAEGKFNTDYVHDDNGNLTMIAEFITDGERQDLKTYEKTPTFKDLDKKF